MKSLKMLGIILIVLGVLIGFFDMSLSVIGSIGFPFVTEITNVLNHSLGLAGIPDHTIAWWNMKLWGLACSTIGIILLKYG